MTKRRTMTMTSENAKPCCRSQCRMGMAALATVLCLLAISSPGCHVT